MYRRGIVSATDPATGRVRVRFPDCEGVESWWLEAAQPATGRNRAYGLPDIGDRVAVVMDERDEAGVVVGSVYSAANPPPVASQDKRHLAMADGMTAEYDRASHTLAVAVPAGGRITLAVAGSRIEVTEAGITLETPGVLTLRAAALAIEAPEGGAGMRGNLAVQENVTASGTVIDGGGNTNHHSH